MGRFSMDPVVTNANGTAITLTTRGTNNEIQQLKN